MASIVGVLLIVLVLIGLPLHYGHLLHEDLFPKGGTAEQLGATISATLGVAHGWLYMIFLIVAFLLSRKAEWELPFTIGTMAMGTVPVLSFWAEHRATKDVRARIAAEEAVPAGSPDRSPDGA
jgi:integral membrane protein